MTQSALLPDIYLPELGEGSGYFLLAFRGLAFSSSGCSCLNRYFARVFGPHGDMILSDIGKLVVSLGWTGRRKIRLAQPGCARVTHDEVSLLSALHAAQSGQSDLESAHLRWLMAGHVPAEVHSYIQSVSGQFLGAGLNIAIPAAPERPADGQVDKLKFGVQGIA